MKSKLIILGCGSSIGVPRVDGFWGKCDKNNVKNIRTRCSAIVMKGSNAVLIDTSPDLRNQLLSNNIKNISSVIFTHEHADQTNGLFELRPFFWKNKKKINIFGNSKTIKAKHGKTSSLIYIFEKTAYISDSNDMSIVNVKELKSLKYLIIDCLKYKKHPSHFNLEESIFIHERLKPRKTILTNLHHDLDYIQLLKKLPRNVIPAYDGLKINLN